MKLFEISIKNNKDINDFSYLEGKIDNFKETILDDKDLIQPDIEDLLFTGKYNKNCGFFITKKIMKSEFFKDVVKRIKEEYLNAHILLHADTMLFISIFCYANSYQSFSSLYSQIYIYNSGTMSKNLKSKYNDFFKVSLYLLKYVYELKYSSKRMFNLHIKLGIRMVNWALRVVGSKKLILNWNVFNETINGILNNTDLNEIKRMEIKSIINSVILKSNNL